MQPKTKSSRDRVRDHRRRMRSAGFKSIQVWVPDPNAPGFAEECRRQSLIIRQDRSDAQDLEQLIEVADWSEE
ncbi:antitoxin MazE family protein [Geoalkalibacter halelectricus]|nr:antitoxin MazE family protein [Geoalkalibacter halelectricus]